MDRIEELTQDCFNAVIAMRRIGDNAGVDPKRLHREMRQHVDRVMQRGAQYGVAHEDAREMAYALVALIDEVALKLGSVSQFWMGQLLQIQYFDENMAGEGFFEHLDAVRSARRYDVLRVYYICLLLGFQGRYAVRGAELELDDVISTVKSALISSGLIEPDALSPHGDRPHEAAAQPPRRLRLLWVPISAAALAGILYFVLSLSVASQASNLSAYIETLIK